MTLILHTTLYTLHPHTSDSGGVGPIRHTPSNHSSGPYHAHGRIPDISHSPSGRGPLTLPSPNVGLGRRASRHGPEGAPAGSQSYSSPAASEPPASVADSSRSVRSDLSGASIRPDTLQFVRENIGALRANVSNTAEFIRVASPIFDIPEHEKWPAALVLILAGLQDMKAELVSHIVAELKPQAADLVSNIVAELKPQAQEVTADQGAAAAKSDTASGLKGFVRSNLRLLLVKGKLDVYGRLTSRKATAAVTPFLAIKATIRQHEQKHPDQFNLPPNYADDAKWNLELDSMITLALKANKHKIVSMLQDHLPTTGKPPAPVPQLADLVTSVFSAMLPRYKDSNPATILREKHTFWSQSNAALQIGKSPMYRFGFARLILRKDAALWDGKKTVDSVTAADCAMPTAAEVEEEIAAYHRQGGEDLATPALANADDFNEA
ncbi:hypothetical protein PTTG_27062 [Puccinia triticina 1-1 BBBD Race 1]|uniref:Uncharacterized protein n=1 Tax=Puccinia triticina (isolate 1-1 / race 1 (BBBD)) TaxID=630390 RepID=A0A180GNA8_PUCT1|nr:hypothetical protein PTTG_27062 [Puccinia triticina 1-1 BBBD Race 1]